MSFMFLHPEFFFWMLPPLGLLFYFWQTQQHLENRWLNEKVLERLRVDTMTMGLKGRNTLFFIAGVLLLAAMAQPVLVDESPLTRTNARVIVTVDASSHDLAAFERTKLLAVETLSALRGENVSVAAYDRTIYRIAPFTQQSGLVIPLVENLNAMDFTSISDRSGMMAKLASIGILDKADAVLIVSSSGISGPISQWPYQTEVIAVSEDINPAVDRIREEVREHQRRFHIPLFYYPLGFAMILILIALSSMSRRQSVPLSGLLMVFILNEPSAHSGILDFQLLKGAQNSYKEGRYHQSAALFAAYQENHDSPQVRYNRANALFKAGRFKESAFWYRQVHTSDPILSEWTRINLEYCILCIHEDRGTDKSLIREGKRREYPSSEQREVKRVEMEKGKTRLFRFE